MKSSPRIWIAFGIAFGLPFLADLVYFAMPANPGVARWGYGVTKVFLLTWPLICVRFLLPKAPAPSSPTKPRHWLSAGLGLGLGLVTLGAILGLMQTGLGDLVREGSPIVKQKMAELGWSEHFLFWMAGIAVIHSAVEEYFWRWFGYGRLARFLPGFRPHIIAAVAFSLHHYVIVWVYFSPWMALWLGTMVGIGGLLWSLLYQKTGSLLGPWISHILIDLAIFWVGWTMLNGQ